MILMCYSASKIGMFIDFDEIVKRPCVSTLSSILTFELVLFSLLCFFLHQLFGNPGQAQHTSFIASLLVGLKNASFMAINSFNTAQTNKWSTSVVFCGP